MIRGTTPTHIFTIPFDVSVIDKCRILYAQNGELIMTKTEADCTMGDKTLTVKLTQEDTLSFKSESLVEMQVRILTVDGDALASDIFKRPVGMLLENGVLE